MIGIRIQVGSVEEVKLSALQLASPEVRKEAIKAGSLSAKDKIEGYYQTRGRNPWLNLALPTHGAGRKQSRWWERVATGWTTKNTSSRVTFENKTIGFAHKITGGTITAKRKKLLTIPVIPEAHGMTAKGYSRSISKLFRIKNTLCQSDQNGGIKPVFVLKKSVTQKPWPNALPSDETYVPEFIESALSYLEDNFQRS
jgi:hypothetical protein